MKRRPLILCARRGAAAVELAVCLPVIVLLVLGAIEGASLLFARQAMVECAYEAAVVAIRDNATNAQAIDAADSVIKSRRLTGLTLTFEPSNVNTTPRGTPVRVTASVPAGSHRLINSRFAGVTTIRAVAVMIKE
jgi:Flp pilus assembly protein TadG